MKPHIRVLLIASALVLIAPAGPAWAKRKTADDPVVQGALGQRLDAAVQRAGGIDFWGSVLVARDGNVLLAKGYGNADYRSQPNTPRTLFELASISKPITAAAVLHLQQRKKLSVTDTLDRFFKDVPEEKRNIQIHHLLTHTSGIDAKLGVPYDSRLSRGQYVRQMLAEPLCAQPGERHEYCNVGYALLAAIVEVVTKQSFEDYVEKYIFKPAKMRESGFIQDRDLVRSKRVSVRRSNRGGPWTAADWHWGWGYRGMGGVVTSTRDLYLWDRALRKGKPLDEAQQDVMYAPFKDGYGYGWRSAITERGTRRVWHTGLVEGYGNSFVRYLEDDACVIVLSNGGQTAHDVSTAIERLLFEPPEIEALIDLRPYEARSDRVVPLPERLAWKTVRHQRELVLQLLDKRHSILEIRAPKTYRHKLIGELEQAMASCKAEADGDGAVYDASLHLRAYNPSDRKIRLRSALAVEIRSESPDEDGLSRRGAERSVHLFLEDRKHGGRPVQVAMNVAAARALLEVLQRAGK